MTRGISVSLLGLALIVLTSSCQNDSDRQDEDSGGFQLSITEDSISDQETVTVVGQGFAPGSIQLVQCNAESLPISPRSDCDMTKASKVLASVSSAGEFSSEYRMSAAIGVGTRKEIVCPDSDCALAVMGARDEVIASVGLEWAADTQLRLPPEIQVLDVQFSETSSRTRIEGSGFAPGSTVTLVQCPSDLSGGSSASVSAKDCLYDYGTTVTVGADGNVVAEMEIQSKFQRSNGKLVMCNRPSMPCVVADPWPTSPDNRMSAGVIRADR